MKYSVVKTNVILTLFIHLVFRLNGNSIQFEQFIDSDGIITDGSLVSTFGSGIPVEIFNGLSKTVNLFYFSESDDEYSFMGHITPGDSVSLNTYPGHHFFATLGNHNTDVIAEIEILEGVLEYILKPNETGERVVLSELSANEGLRYVDEGLSRSVHARFCSLSSRTLALWSGKPWEELNEDDDEPFLSTLLRSGEDTTYDTFQDYDYFYTPEGDNTTILGKYIVDQSQPLYVLYDEEYPISQEKVELVAQELDFIEAYRNRTGIPWRSYYGLDGPRPPPALHMWPNEELGQLHTVTTNHGYWKCDGPASDCHSNDSITLQLEVVSLEPKVLLIKNFLSNHEADTIISIAKPNLRASRIGQEGEGGIMVSETRTSSNTWVNRKISKETETITLRAADLLGVDEDHIRLEKGAEELQVVHYEVDQKYNAHHDWSVGSSPNSRFITLLFYLNDKKHPDAGGETSFPKAADGRGIMVHPGKGSAVLFYNLLSDGNGDDLSLHEARPVLDGEKWLANYWIWDPALETFS